MTKTHINRHFDEQNNQWFVIEDLDQWISTNHTFDTFADLDAYKYQLGAEDSFDPFIGYAFSSIETAEKVIAYLSAN